MFVERESRPEPGTCRPSGAVQRDSQPLRRAEFSARNTGRSAGAHRAVSVLASPSSNLRRRLTAGPQRRMSPYRCREGEGDEVSHTAVTTPTGVAKRSHSRARVHSNHARRSSRTQDPGTCAVCEIRPAPTWVMTGCAIQQPDPHDSARQLARTTPRPISGDGLTRRYRSSCTSANDRGAGPPASRRSSSPQPSAPAMLASGVEVQTDRDGGESRRRSRCSGSLRTGGTRGLDPPSRGRPGRPTLTRWPAVPRTDGRAERRTTGPPRAGTRDQVTLQ